MKRSENGPILNAIIKHHKSGVIPFHMPGHKQGIGVSRRFFNAILDNPFAFDMTEVPGLDDLHAPKEAIKKAQELAAEVFGADLSFFLVNGTTVGIHGAIMSLCGPGDEILLPRDVHRAAIGACILSGAKPRYIKNRIDQDFSIPLPPDPTEVKSCIQNNSSIKSVFVTYPSYYGLAGRLAEIVADAHAVRIPVIVDEAHGAHFRFSSSLPKTALEVGADISIQSTHKTLGAFTQASMLHIKEGLIDAQRVFRFLKILQTISPSYLLMTSLEATTEHMKESGALMLEKTMELAEKARNGINSIHGFKCLGAEILQERTVAGFDPTKLYISVKGTGLTGYQVEQILRQSYGIQVELSDLYSILCMVSIGNLGSDIKALIMALKDLSKRYGSKKNAQSSLNASYIVQELPLPEVVLTPREAWLAQRRKVRLTDAIGEIAAEIVAPYPPGIPLLCPGEKITMEVVECIKQFKNSRHHFQGPSDTHLDFLEIVD